jgi:hypothetical protein
MKERMGQAGLFGVSDHLKRLLAFGDLLEAWGRIAEFRDIFCPVLIAALASTKAR